MNLFILNKKCGYTKKSFDLVEEDIEYVDCEFYNGHTDFIVNLRVENHKPIYDYINERISYHADLRHTATKYFPYFQIIMTDLNDNSDNVEFKCDFFMSGRGEYILDSYQDVPVLFELTDEERLLLTEACVAELCTV